MASRGGGWGFPCGCSFAWRSLRAPQSCPSMFHRAPFPTTAGIWFSLTSDGSRGLDGRQAGRQAARQCIRRLRLRTRRQGTYQVVVAPAAAAAASAEAVPSFWSNSRSNLTNYTRPGTTETAAPAAATTTTTTTTTQQLAERTLAVRAEDSSLFCLD